MKKILSLMLCVSMIFVSFICASADTVNFTYETDSDGYLIITGCTSAISGTLTIPAEINGAKVKSVGNSAFEGIAGITEVIIGSGIAEVKESAFMGCTSLVTVTAGDTLKTVGELAFSQCVNLANINMSGVESIGRNAFLGTAWYNNHESKTCVYLGNVLYKYKGSMPEGTGITVEEGTVSISDNAFDTCMGLVSVSLPESLKHIGSSAFVNCRVLEKVTAKGGIQSVGAMAFLGTAWYNAQPEGVVYLGTVAIGYKSGGTSENGIVIKEGTTAISDYAFNGFTDIQSVALPEGLLYIGREAFYGCTSLGSFDVPDSVTEVGYLAFGFYGDTQAEKLIGFMFEETESQTVIEYAETHGFPVGGAYNLGDVNLDGKVNVSDAVLISRYSADLVNMVGISLINADVNSDGNINVSDAVIVSRISAGLI